MRCAAIMNASPMTLRMDESVATAAHKLIAQRSTNLAVVDADHRYLGSFGIDDLLGLIIPRVALAGSLSSNLRFIDDDPRRLGERYQAVKTQSVGELADRNAIVLAPDTPLIEAFRILCRNRISLPVVESASRRLLGTVTYWDVIGSIMADA